MKRLNQKGASEVLSYILVIFIVIVVVGLIVSGVMPAIERTKSQKKFQEAKMYISEIEKKVNELMQSPIGSITSITLDLDEIFLEIDSNLQTIKMVQTIYGDYYKEGDLIKEGNIYTFREMQKLIVGLDLIGIEIIDNFYLTNSKTTVYIKKIDRNKISFLREIDSSENVTLQNTEKERPKIPTVENPIFEPIEGIYDDNVTITLSTTTADSNIRYTLDGSDPSAKNGILYTGSFSLTETKTVKAIAYKTGWLNSSIVASTYTINIPLRFISTWKTDNTSTGSSSNNQVKLPLVNGGTYDFNVDWGDGTPQDRITVWNQAHATHTYSSIGTYTIRIVGTINGFRFNNTGDRLKLLEISKFGPLRLGNAGYYFYGASNLTITATDVLDLNGTTNLSEMFRDCSSLTTVPSMNSWDVSNVTNMNGTFYSVTNFNQPIGSWNVSNVTNMQSMFYGATNFNQPIGSWNVSNVTNMQSMFYGATNFNQPIGSWNVSNVTNMTSMFLNKTLTTQNYDNLLIGWAPQSLKTEVSFHAGSSKYSAGDAATAKATIISKGWTITDGGQES